MITRTCSACGTTFDQLRGRPRLWCFNCSPPVSLVGKSVVARAWRRLNPLAVAAYNEERRWRATWERS